jgi:hypothetical protein
MKSKKKSSNNESNQQQQQQQQQQQPKQQPTQQQQQSKKDNQQKQQSQSIPSKSIITSKHSDEENFSGEIDFEADIENRKNQLLIEASDDLTSNSFERSPVDVMDKFEESLSFGGLAKTTPSLPMPTQPLTSTNSNIKTASSSTASPPLSSSPQSSSSASSSPPSVNNNRPLSMDVRSSSADDSGNLMRLHEIDLNILSDLSDESAPPSLIVERPQPSQQQQHNQQQIFGRQQQTNENSYEFFKSAQQPIAMPNVIKNQPQLQNSPMQAHLYHQHHQHHHHHHLQQQQQQQQQQNHPNAYHLEQHVDKINLPTSIYANEQAQVVKPKSGIIDSSMVALNQPQKLDNTAIQTLVADQVTSHLILDDEERLQVKSPNEFVSLFRTATSSSSSSSAVSLSPMSSSKLGGLDDIVAKPIASPIASASTSSLSAASAATTAAGASTSLISHDKLVKCVSIFGNTGDGKSHTLNHTFFNGRGIFRTSNKQETCTMGAWAAYDSLTNSLIFDTEGLLGTTSNENKRIRLLLKVLAVSDVIIYRTRAERLHNDLFKFLSDASIAYLKYFSKELKLTASKLKLDTITTLGPCCVIFHETQHTDCLCDEVDANGHLRTVSHQIADRFHKQDLNFNAFSSIEYVGTRTSYSQGGTNFTQLAATVRDLLRNNSVRPPRKLSSIYQVLKILNDKFNGTISKNQISTFADEYFTCSAVCLSCGKRCQNSINHFKDGIMHENTERCHYDHQYDNKVYVCKVKQNIVEKVVLIITVNYN